MRIANDNDIANDNEVAVRPIPAPGDSILPRDIRDMLDECDRVGLGMDFVMTVFRAELRAKGLVETKMTARVLTAFRNVIERNR